MKLWTPHFISVVLVLCSLIVACAAASGEQEPIPAPSDVAAPPSDAHTTPSGLATKVVEAGSGTEHPGPTSQVTVHYTGWTTDGEMFDTSVGGLTSTFGLDQVIAGWTEGLQLMVEGEEAPTLDPRGSGVPRTAGPPGRHARVRRRAHPHPIATTAGISRVVVRGSRLEVSLVRPAV